MKPEFSYKTAGVDIKAANTAKTKIKSLLNTQNSRVLNKVGAFASLLDLDVPQLKHPVLVLKMEEPGSKQKLAFAYNRLTSLAYDLVNHLVNDTIVMGAQPLAVLDVIVCGQLDPKKLITFIGAMSQACREQECELVGGETSEQPGVLDPRTFILAASMVGIVDKAKIVDGSAIRVGDCVLALPSNGLHTNGYSLVRKLIEVQPQLLKQEVEGESFLDAIMRPHMAYYRHVKLLFNRAELHGMAHITGGGISENLNRILPPGLDARIDISTIKVPPLFKVVQEAGNLSYQEMWRTFNMGVGMALVIDQKEVNAMQNIIQKTGIDSYMIGEIVPGRQKVRLEGQAM